jgi:hypothetical protein
MEVGSAFSNASELKRVVREMAIAGHFKIIVVKSSKTRYTVKCKVGNCPWRLHAAKAQDAATFTVSAFTSDHRCAGADHLGNRHATCAWVANEISGRLQDTPSYRPKEMTSDIRRAHSTSVPYMQAWRAKERAYQALHGSYEESYKLFPTYCEEFKKANPGSTADLEIYSDHLHFRRVFIAFGASVDGLRTGGRLLVGIDGLI